MKEWVREVREGWIFRLDFWVLTDFAWGVMSKEEIHGWQEVTGLGRMTPVEVAKRMEGMEGFVFLDTAGNVSATSRGMVSILAAEPVAEHRGDLVEDTARERLKEVLAKGGRRLIGYIEYEGGYCFGEYEAWLEYDHEAGEWRDRGGMWDRVRDRGVAERAEVWVEGMESTLTRQRFIEQVRRVKEWIAAGDIYQVNLSQSIEGRVVGGSLYGLYEYLREVSPAPMAAWMSLGGRELLCSSPELFLKVEEGRIETRPIKGTRPRGRDRDEDFELAKELQASEKERAELVMITDLLRNDLGRVCGYGSVRVEELLRLETLEQVFHLVSTVTGEMRPGLGMVDALAECFPGGSITGAPKIRAMEIIAELEQRQRGVYCGALGWMGEAGEGQFNIAIRTIEREGEFVRYQVGAGIVADSDPEMEYQETLDKAAGMGLAMAKWAESRARQARD